MHFCHGDTNQARAGVLTFKFLFVMYEVTVLLYQETQDAVSSFLQILLFQIGCQIQASP